VHGIGSWDFGQLDFDNDLKVLAGNFLLAIGNGDETIVDPFEDFLVKIIAQFPQPVAQRRPNPTGP